MGKLYKIGIILMSLSGNCGFGMVPQIQNQLEAIGWGFNGMFNPKVAEDELRKHEVKTGHFTGKSGCKECQKEKLKKQLETWKISTSTGYYGRKYDEGLEIEKMEYTGEDDRIRPRAHFKVTHNEVPVIEYTKEGHRIKKRKATTNTSELVAVPSASEKNTVHIMKTMYPTTK